MSKRIWLLAWVVWATGLVHAHDSGIASVTLTESVSGQWLIESKTRGVDEPGAPVLPEGFTVSANPIHIEQGARIQSWTAIRNQSLRSSESIHLPWSVGGAFVSANWADGMTASYFFKSNDQGVVVEVSRIGGSAGSLLAVVWSFIYLGIEHILSGWDHLAFVIAIFLMSRGRGLVKLITGFTIGHSFTLGAAALGWVHLPSPPVEAAIALSIVLVAAQSFGKDDNAKHGFWVVFGFGLLHGLGFAGALAEIGLPKRELLTGLLSFNIGVELGQLAFVAMVAGIAGAGRNLSRSISHPVPVWARATTACALIAIGSFWTIERVLGFSG